MLCSHTPDCAYQLTDPLSVWLSAARSPLPPFALPWSIIMLTWAERGRLPSTFDSHFVQFQLFLFAIQLNRTSSPYCTRLSARLSVCHRRHRRRRRLGALPWLCANFPTVFSFLFIWFLLFYLLPLKRYVQFSALVLVRFFFGVFFFPAIELESC